MKDLANKTYVVTGGSTGIGYSTAEQLIAHGAKVIITGRNNDSLQNAATNLGAIAINSDQADLQQIAALAEQIRSEFGQIDGLFVNAGVGSFAPVEGVEESAYDWMMNINVKGVFFTVKHFIPLLKDGASIVFNSSVNATLGVPGSSVYGMTKAALLSFNRILAAELAPRGIRVNAVSPGPVHTPIYGKLGMDEEQLAGFAAGLSNQILLKRFAEADEVANLVRFLLSDESSFITGTEQVIDGGLLVKTLQ